MLILARSLFSDVKLRIIFVLWLFLAILFSAQVQALFKQPGNNNVFSVNAKQNTPKPPQPNTNSQNTEVKAKTAAAKTVNFNYSLVWDRLAVCESSGNWAANTGNGYYGGLQFSLSSWNFVGGTGYPHEATKQEQITRAEKLKAVQGWSAWPSCSEKLALA